MSAPAPGVALGLLAYRQWLAWPDALVARAPGLRGIAGDGHVLLAVPVLAVLAPVVTVLVAFATGVSSPGYDVVYTESVAVLAVAVAVGAVSTQLGALAVAAWAVGDVVRALRAGAPGTAASPADVVDGWLPVLVTHLLLLSLVVVLPRSVRAVVGSTGAVRRVPAALAWPLSGGLVVLLTWVTVTAWVAAAPTLVRPVFTWPGGQPTVEAVATLQESGDRVVAAALVAAIARHVWVGATMLPGPWRRRVRAAEALLATSPPPSAPARATTGPGGVSVGGGVLDLVAAALATLALAGVLLEAWVWVACFAVFLAVRVLRRDVVAWSWLTWWKGVAARAPAWARLLVLFLLARLVVDASSTTLLTSYTHLALLVLAGVVVAFAVFPGTPPAGPPRHLRGVASAAGAVVALWAVAQWWTGTPTAAADNCGDFTDCFDQANTATEAALGLGLLAILSLVLDFVPVVGTAKGVAEGITGRDLLTGQELAPWERALGFVPYGRVGRLAGMAGDLAPAARHADDIGVAAGAAGGAADGAGRHAGDLPAAGTRAADDTAAAGRPPAPSPGGAGGPGRGSGQGSGGGGGGRPPGDGDGPAPRDPLDPRQLASLQDALRPAKMDHVFDPKHNFAPLIEMFGSRERVMEGFVRSIDGPLPASGPFEVVREVGGRTVVIRGAVVAGVPRIGTAFTP